MLNDLICLYSRSTECFYEKWKKYTLLHKIASWIIGILLFWNWINNMWSALLCISTEQQSFIGFVVKSCCYFPASTGDLQKKKKNCLESLVQQWEEMKFSRYVKLLFILKDLHNKEF